MHKNKCIFYLFNLFLEKKKIVKKLLLAADSPEL